MTWRGGAQTAFKTRTGRYATGCLIGVLGQLLPGRRQGSRWPGITCRRPSSGRCAPGSAPRRGLVAEHLATFGIGCGHRKFLRACV